MARLVTIPTGVRNRRGSDGSGFAVGVQSATGTPVTRVNYTSTAGSDDITSGQAAGATVRFY